MKTLSEQHRKKISEAHKGKKLSEETKRKVGLASKGRNANEKHGMWKGDNVSYPALHTWIRKNLPQKDLCELCLKVSPKDVACITGIYNREFKNWLRLCRLCHMISDGRLERITKIHIM